MARKVKKMKAVVKAAMTKGRPAKQAVAKVTGRKAKGKMAPKPVAVPRKTVAVATASGRGRAAGVDGPSAGAPVGTYLEYPVLAGDTFPDLVQELDRLKQQKATIETRVQELTEEVEALLMASGEKSVTVGQLAVTRYESEGRKSLSKEKLLENGVSADTIMASMVVGDPYSSIRLTPLRAKAEELNGGMRKAG